MSDKELNSYKLTSMEEPTDEMLSAIMKEAAEDAASLWKQAERRLFEQLGLLVNKSTQAI